MRCQPRGGYCEESSSSGCASHHGCGAAARAVSCFNRRAWNGRRTRRRTRRPRARRWWAGDGQASVELVSDRGDDVRLSPAGFVLRLPQRASGRCRQRSPCRVQSAIGGHLSFRIPNTRTRTVSTRPVQRIVELIYTDCARRSWATALGSSTAGPDGHRSAARHGLASLRNLVEDANYVNQICYESARSDMLLFDVTRVRVAHGNRSIS
jgi:hypothetical protein